MALYEFRQRFALPHIWPVPLVDLCNFVAYLFQAQLSHSSGISFFSKINDLEDSTQKFVVRKMLERVKRSKKKNKDSRLPVTLNTLKMILKNLHLICISKYETTLFSAAFSFAYFGLCRISEIAVSKAEARHIISVNDITFAQNFIKVRIPSSKTNQNGIGATLILQMQPEPEICSYLLSRIYIQDRPKFAGPLYCHYDGTPITRYQFTAMLKKNLCREQI